MIQINIDASSLSSAACVLHWKRVVVDGYREKVSGASLVYGSAVHKYIDMMYQTKGNIALARNAAYEVFRRPKIQTSDNYHLLDERHLLTTCYNVWEDFILRDSNFQTLELPNGKPATELNFSIPYKVIGDYQINLCGTIDRLGKLQGGCYLIRDFKTTSRYNVKEYLADYKMSKQLRFYTLALRLMHRMYPDSLLGQIGGTTLGAQIDGIFLKSKPSDNEYVSSDVFMFTNETMEEFEEILNYNIDRLISAIQQDKFLREGIVNGTCKSEYRCKFWGVCGAPKEVQTTMLERDFQKVPYNPLAFGETL